MQPAKSRNLYLCSIYSNPPINRASRGRAKMHGKSGES